MIDFDPSARRVLGDLRSQYPDTKFLALGQTVWWDEPMKAVLRQMLDSMGLGGQIVLGVHDTDYFAKAQVRRPEVSLSRFELMAHNDGTTKDLWSAAGEISRLFGSETFPTRSEYNRYGVPLKRLSETAAAGKQPFIDDSTEAWGWRGLVYTGSRDLIVHRLPLADMGDSIEQMLTWGFAGTRESLVDSCCRDEAADLASCLLQLVSAYRTANPGSYLSNLYGSLFPNLFEALLKSPPSGTEIDCTGHLLLLNPESAGLPRFELADLFLRQETRALAAGAYNEAVSGTEMYTLDKFGLGALPFDLVLPVHGRGTLRVTLRAIHVETRNPIRIPLSRPIENIRELAEVLTHEFGDHVTLVGKAVALVSMLAREFLFVFNEEGSAYVTRTRKMNDILRAGGVNFPVHPIVRLRYRTWDALSEAGATLNLPDHLASTFGQRTIPAPDFAARWRRVVQEQSDLLSKLRCLTRPRDLISFLAEREGGAWPEVRAEYERAKSGQVSLQQSRDEIRKLIESLYANLAEVKRKIVETERAKGDHFRATSTWTPEAVAAREAFENALYDLLDRRRVLLHEIRRSKERRLALERSPEMVALRAESERIENEAGLAKLRLVKHAVLTCSGLEHTNHRPSAWWLPMVDPSGRWFERIAATTEVYLQPLHSDSVTN